MIDGVLPQFIGDIRQRPPIHSAVKIAGRRAYKLARQGADFELAERTVTIHQVDVLRYEYPELELEIECGSGTYIRAVGRDLGAALGTAAVMSALERTAIGPFQVEQSILLDRLSTDELLHSLQPALAAVSGLALLELSEAEIIEIRHGRPIPMPSRGEVDVPLTSGPELAAVNSQGELVALLTEKQSGQLWPQHNFRGSASAESAVDPD
jgi:tRNA pseudouridine55 synthase